MATERGWVKGEQQQQQQVEVVEEVRLPQK
jgi:hypothetical protein